MRYFSTIFLLGSACVATAGLTTGQRSSLVAIRGVFERQLQICKPVPAPATCEKSCGPGNIQCISFPNCYNPSAGESCCSNGKFCSANTYCTDAGCCPSGSTLAECGASVSLSVIPPPAETSTAPSSESTSSSFVVTTSSASPTTSDSTTSYSYSTAKTSNSTTYSTPYPTAASNSTATTTGVLQVTGAAQKLGSEVVLIALGGIAALFVDL